MLEIVYDLAPGASLFFATADGGEAGMATNIQALRDTGCDIIVDDVGYLSEPVFQDGIIAQAVDAVAASGALYFSAAGNGGSKDHGTSGTWEGDYAASSSTIAVSDGALETLHSFGATSDDTITAEPPDYITLQWSDAYGTSANDYDLFLLDAGGNVVAASTDDQSGSGDPFEAIDTSTFQAKGLRLAIGNFGGAAARYLHLDVNGGGLAISTAGEIWGHPAAVNAIGVAAVSAAGMTSPFVGGAANRVEPFSSDGPRRVFFEADGWPITPGNFLSTGGSVRQKPDVAAADGVQVATLGFNPFYGTSAAAPHAAAIAALVMSADPTLTATQIRAALTSTALDIEAPDVDRDSGAGLLDALGAVQSVIAASTTTPTRTRTSTAPLTPAATRTPTPLPSATLSASATVAVTATATDTPTLTVTPAVTAPPAATPTPLAVCIGDCDHSRTVTVDELVTGVSIALNAAPLSACPAFSEPVTADKLVAAVNNALNGCPSGGP